MTSRRKVERVSNDVEAPVQQTIREASRRRGRPSRGQSENLTETILEVAGELFLEGGFRATSMDSIAARTGSSKRTLYARFPSKILLFQAVIQRLSMSNTDDIAKFATSREPIGRRLHMIAGIALARSLDPASIALFRLMIAEAHRFPDLALIDRDWYLDPLTNAVARVFQKAVDRGEIVDGGAMLMSEQFLAAVCALEVRRVALGHDGHAMTDARKDRLTRAVDMFLAGVRASDPQAA